LPLAALGHLGSIGARPASTRLAGGPIPQNLPHEPNRTSIAPAVKHAKNADPVGAASAAINRA
jgi:hypothetical protein